MRLVIRPPAAMADAEIELDDLEFPDHWWDLYPDGIEEEETKKKKKHPGIPLPVLEGLKWCSEHKQEWTSHYSFDRSVWIATIIESILFDCDAGQPCIAIHFTEDHPSDYTIMQLPDDTFLKLQAQLKPYLDSENDDWFMAYDDLLSLLIDIYSLKVVPYLKTSGAVPLTYISCLLEAERRVNLGDAVEMAQALAEQITITAEGPLDPDLEEWVNRMTDDRYEDLLEELLVQDNRLSTPPSTPAGNWLPSTPAAGASSDIDEYSSPTKSPTPSRKRKLMDGDSVVLSFRDDFTLNSAQLCLIDARANVLLPPPLHERGLFRKMASQDIEMTNDLEEAVVIALNSLRKTERKIELDIEAEQERIGALMPDEFRDNQPEHLSAHEHGLYTSRFLRRQLENRGGTLPAPVDASAAIQSSLRKEYDVSKSKPKFYVDNSTHKLVQLLHKERSAEQEKQDKDREAKAAIEGKSAVTMLLTELGVTLPNQKKKRRTSKRKATPMKEKRKRKRKAPSTRSPQATLKKLVKKANTAGADAASTLGVLGPGKLSSRHGNNGNTGSPMSARQRSSSTSGRNTRSASSSSETGDADSDEDDEDDWKVKSRGLKVHRSARDTSRSGRERKQSSQGRSLSRQNSSINLRMATPSRYSPQRRRVGCTRVEEDEEEGVSDEAEDWNNNTGYWDDDVDSIMPGSTQYQREFWEDSESDSDEETDEEMEGIEVAQSLIPVPRSFSPLQDTLARETDDADEEDIDKEDETNGSSPVDSDEEDHTFINGLMQSFVEPICTAVGSAAETTKATSATSKRPVTAYTRWKLSNERDADSSDASGESGDGESDGEGENKPGSDISTSIDRPNDSGSFEVDSDIPVIASAPSIKYTYGTKRKHAEDQENEVGVKDFLKSVRYYEPPSPPKRVYRSSQMPTTGPLRSPPRKKNRGN